MVVGNQNDITSDSRTTVIVPAAGPYNNTEAKTNVSDTDTRAGNVDIPIENEPVRRVSAAKMNHWLLTGLRRSCRAEYAKTIAPAAITAVTYGVADRWARAVIVTPGLAPVISV